ncbi:MAG: hypothetical protein HRT88_18725, partial [Lentisphaeraceae bacterium]|nr:hypothetical protein [Lentisphaeraceae bacterium]
FRSESKINALLNNLKKHGISDLFPHLCPCSEDGSISAYDDLQVERLVNSANGLRVIPWVGGVYRDQCVPENKKWRHNFVLSISELFKKHPKLAGIQINIEPMPDNTESFITLLKEIKIALPQGKVLSVAAYPPPTKWHPFPEVHWSKNYFTEVTQNCDQVAVMMYDTAVRFDKFYIHLMKEWSNEVLNWSSSTPVLLGIPAYDDSGTGYHYPEVENITSALKGIKACLNNKSQLPENLQGLALYCEWQMNEEKWQQFADKIN